MSEKHYLYPVWTRLWHLLNALLIILLIITGISMQYALSELGFIKFSTAVKIHNISGLILTVSYLFFVLGNLFSSNGKHYQLFWKSFSKEIIAQVKYYLIGMFKKEKKPFHIDEKNKFNPMQKVTYTILMYIFVPLIILSGIALMFPDVIVIKKVFNYSGILFTSLIHIVIGFIISIFLIVHLYLCTIGIRKANTFKSMITGYHINTD